MTSFKLRGRRWPVAVALGLVALAIGAIFGTTGNGSAAIAVKPANLTAPAISGTPQEGSTLTTSNGTWSGTSPIAFTYQWSRCDTNGKSCAAISGASSAFYVLQHVDVGNTLIVAVQGANADGVDGQPSAPTPVITAPATPAPATGCPSGNGLIQIADLAPPARLQIVQQTITPGVVTPSTKSIQVHVKITACSGRPVQGALVYVTAVPYNQYTVAPEGTTDANGTVDVTETQLSGFPASRQQQLLVMFLRARKSGEDLTAGISTRLLVSFPVSLK
jgi:hypothetical protein